MKQIIFLLVSIIMISFAACKDKTPAPELPPYTETGENTFGCYVDGVPYALFIGRPGGFSSTTVYFNEFSDVLRFVIKNDTPYWYLSMNILNPEYKVGIFKTNGYPGVHPFQATFISDNTTGAGIYESSPDVYITVDLKKAIKGSHYSGTFEGELVNGEGKIIKITEGRFDIKRK